MSDFLYNKIDFIIMIVLALLVAFIIGFNIIQIVDSKLSSVTINVPPQNYQLPPIYLSVDKESGDFKQIKLNDVVCDKYYNKFKCIFNVNSHKDLIEEIKLIEESILNKFKNTLYNKHPEFKINEQFKNGFIKIFQEISGKSVHNFILKISGVWETQTSYGLTYKFVKINQ